MSILERIRQRAIDNPQHIVLPEGNDPRTVIAAAACTQGRIARITLLGDEAKIREIAQRESVDLGGVAVIDQRRAPDFEKMVSLFQELRRAKGMMTDRLRRRNRAYGRGTSRDSNGLCRFMPSFTRYRATRGDALVLHQRERQTQIGR